jgi:hypothetical protein
MTINITDVRNQLKVAVEEYGENWVSKPINVYEQGGETRMCIASKILNLMGVEEAGLASLGSFCDITDTARHLGVEIENSALRFLVDAQTMQDNGLTWGDVQSQLI